VILKTLKGCRHVAYVGIAVVAIAASPSQLRVACASAAGLIIAPCADRREGRPWALALPALSSNVEGRAMRNESMLLPGHKSAEPPVLRIRPIPPEPDCETVEVVPVPDHSQRDEAHRK
jgi:hypothetical protein